MKCSNFALWASVAAFSACAHSPARKDASALGSQSADAAGAKAEPDVRAATMIQIPEIQAVRFDYDSAALGADARTQLTANARWLEAHPEVQVQVAGHCDERGTVEY